MTKHAACPCCGRVRTLYVTRVGFRCETCRSMLKTYRQHWFVRSLEYKKPQLRPVKQKKSLPGQLSLFDQEPTDD